MRTYQYLEPERQAAEEERKAKEHRFAMVQACKEEIEMAEVQLATVPDLTEDQTEALCSIKDTAESILYSL